MITEQKIKTPPLLSPLRYPGGKRRFARSIAGLLDARLTRPLHLVIEPFAGSAAVALALLEAGYTEHIALCDADPLVGNFWRVVFGSDRRYANLREWIASTPITLGEFHEVRRLKPRSPVEAAFKCLFLSRTSFSGVLHPHAGPIGGQKQASDYPIHCRFPRDKILKRLDSLHAMRGRVLYAGVRHYADITGSVPVGRAINNEPAQVLWYFDPPFFCKAEKLYNYTFDTEDHRHFHTFVTQSLVGGHWIISYDDVPEARQIWSGTESISEASLKYSASMAARHGTKQVKRAEVKELILSSFFGDSPSVIINLHGRHNERTTNTQFIGKESLTA